MNNNHNKKKSKEDDRLNATHMNNHVNIEWTKNP